MTKLTNDQKVVQFKKPGTVRILRLCTITDKIADVCQDTYEDFVSLRTYRSEVCDECTPPLRLKSNNTESEEPEESEESEESNENMDSFNIESFNLEEYITTKNTMNKHAKDEIVLILVLSFLCILSYRMKILRFF